MHQFEKSRATANNSSVVVKPTIFLETAPPELKNKSVGVPFIGYFSLKSWPSLLSTSMATFRKLELNASPISFFDKTSFSICLHVGHQEAWGKYEQRFICYYGLCFRYFQRKKLEMDTFLRIKHWLGFEST